MKAKRVIRRLLSRVFGRPVSEARKYAERAGMISFDIFDTLIKRTCLPHEVFSLVQDKYNSSHAAKISSFTEDRTCAERTARAQGLRDEVTLGEIYGSFSGRYGQDELAELQALEIEAELEAVYPDDEVKAFYDSMLEEGRRVIITSDMYLPVKVIEDILRRCGYVGCEGLYVSSEYGTTKRCGKLFRCVIDEEGLPASSILHIGDNIISDFLVPNRLGIKGFLYRCS